MIKLTFLSFLLACNTNANQTVLSNNQVIIPGAERFELYEKHLKGKSVALVANQASTFNDTHLLDFFIQKKVDVHSILTPEHGFRGDADAGELIKSNIDNKTGIPIISLYGKNKKPTSEQLKGVDILVFDLQDVGVRFYTYISTLHYVMEACAERSIPVIILDRPNPNAHYIDGPVLEPEFQSFVGMHPVPVIYGMTIGEYGKMINGEKWLANGVRAELNVIPCKNYNHKSYYELPIKPSPNLPNIRSILLYPSLCFFEGTQISVGRGTNKQFQIIGSPLLQDKKTFQFKPTPMSGAKYPKHQDQICYGDDLSNVDPKELHKHFSELDLSHLIQYSKLYDDIQQAFFLENNFIDKLAGTKKLRTQIIEGKTEKQIRATWQEDLNRFKIMRAKYLIYD